MFKASNLGVMLVPPLSPPKRQSVTKRYDFRCQTILFPYQSHYNCFNFRTLTQLVFLSQLTFCLTVMTTIPFAPFFSFNWLGHVSVDLDSLTRHRATPAPQWKLRVLSTGQTVVMRVLTTMLVFFLMLICFVAACGLFSSCSK